MGATVQISDQNNLERNFPNKEENFQNSYTILRGRRPGIFIYALRLFTLVLATLFLNAISAETLFSKENYDPRYSYEPARPTNYEPAEPKNDYQNYQNYQNYKNAEYNYGGSGYQNNQYHYGNSDYYLLSYLYYLWYWIWCNIVVIIIIIIIVWLIIRWYYICRINAEFAAAESRLPAAGDLTVGNARFMLGTLRNSLPL